jgi:hypothetical protein
MTLISSDSNTWVSWTITCSCKSDSFEQISALAAKMTEYFQSNEPDTTNFEFSVNAAHDEIHVHERYLNSAQALLHMKAFGDLFGSDFMSLLTPVKVVAYGFPTDELSAALDALSPVKMNTFQGFTR